MKLQKAGFTLIELLVVIAIIAVLMGILMPVLSRARASANLTACSSQLRQIGLAIPAYAADFDSKMPWWGYTDSGSEEMHPYVCYRQDWVFSTGKLKAMRMACLYEGKYIPEPRVFYCPSNRIPLYKYESYIVPPPWGKLPQKFNASDPSSEHNQWVRMGYTYYPTSRVGKKDEFGIPQEAAQIIEQLNQRIPYMTDVMRHKIELSHKTRSTYALNALFGDGHVIPCKTQKVFNNPIWDDWESGGVDWREFYYKVFKLISENK
jgi:prepilin-type N-terminal cleavage/methylation domain-containing protein/prepilin-type processing-associated H-X9-DG protein